MPTFFYVAKSSSGEEKSGFIEAKNEHQLAQSLKKEGFLLIRAELEKGRSKKREVSISIPFFERVSLTDKMMFTRNLQVMIKAGLSLPKALEVLSLQTKNKKFAKTLLEIRDEITKGKNFSESLLKYPSIFSELFQNMIKVGEETGSLDKVLKVLSQQMEREHELKSKITEAMVYPAVVISAMIGVGFLMLIMVVPQLAATFEELEIELPLTTQIVVGLGTSFKENWFLAFLFVLILFVFFGAVKKTKRGKKIIDLLSLKIPVISGIIIKTNCAYMTRNLGSLAFSGVPIVKSLEIVSGTLGNIYFKETLMQAAEKVKKGERLSDSLDPYSNIYSPLVIQMIKVGEETGETSDILLQLATFFEEETASVTKRLVSIIEPVLMIIIGVVIGFFAISMVQPMYSMLGAIK